MEWLKNKVKKPNRRRHKAAESSSQHRDLCIQKGAYWELSYIYFDQGTGSFKTAEACKDNQVWKKSGWITRVRCRGTDLPTDPGLSIETNMLSVRKPREALNFAKSEAGRRSDQNNKDTVAWQEIVDSVKGTGIELKEAAKRLTREEFDLLVVDIFKPIDLNNLRQNARCINNV